MSSFQSDMLYNTLGMMNPATQAVATCMSGIDSLSGSLNMKLDMIIQNQSGTQSEPIMVSPFTTGNTNTTGTVRVIENLVLPTTATGN